MEQHPRYKAEVDWPDLQKEPWRLFGYTYIYLVASLVAVGWLYLGNVSVAGKNTVPSAVVKDSSAHRTDVPLRTPRVLPPVDVMAVSVATEDLLSKGRALYSTQCASCHGEKGAGDGPAGVVLNPKPRDFRSLSNWTNGSKISGIFKTLQEGIVANGMASYSYLPPLDRFALAHYVRTFAKGQPQDAPEELRKLDELYSLSVGVDISAQIPIKRASDILETEKKTFVENVLRAAETSDNELFRRLALDRVRAMSTLAGFQRRGAMVNEVTVAVSRDPLQAGFKPEVARLSASEWTTLYQAAPRVR